MGRQWSAQLKPQLWDVFSPRGGHVLRAASRVHSQCVPGRALLSFAQDNRTLNAVVLRMQLEPERASFCSCCLTEPASQRSVLVLFKHNHQILLQGQLSSQAGNK